MKEFSQSFSTLNSMTDEKKDGCRWGPQVGLSQELLLLHSV